MKKKKVVRLFTAGDLISDFDRTDIRIILDVKYDKYEYINLRDQCFNDVLGQPINIKKGTTGMQPTDIIEKHFCIIELHHLYSK